MRTGPKGHIERLPSGSLRVVVFAGYDPVTKRRVYFRETVGDDETEAQIKLGELLKKARDGKQPVASATVARLLDDYAPIAEWEDTTRYTNEGLIRRVIKPALGHLEIRRVQGQVLDMLYNRLRRCSDQSCTGKPFTEHRNIPVLTTDPSDPRPRSHQVADGLRAAIRSGELQPGDELPSFTEAQERQAIGAAVYRNALSALAREGLVIARPNRSKVVAGSPPGRTAARWRPGPGHDCARAGCRPHQCRPMQPSTIHGIHSILSGAFATAQRWGWIDFNPTDSARPPTVRSRPVPATAPEDVTKLITQARAGSIALGLYVWLAAITGLRRGELCGLKICDIDLDHRVLHVAFNYIVRGGKRLRKDTKSHQERHLAIDEVTCGFIAEYLDEIRAPLATVGVQLPDGAYLFSNDPQHATAWNPDWTTHQVDDAAKAAGVRINIKALRHYTASQLLAASFDLRNTAARLGHSGGGATTLKHYADPVSEVDRRAAAYLAQLTAGGRAHSTG